MSASLEQPRTARVLMVTATWGGCFVLIRWGLRDAPVLWFAALRSLLAGAVLLAVAGSTRRPLPRDGRSWTVIAALALTNAGVGFAAMFGGVAGLATGTAAVLANAQPLLILVPAWLLYDERLDVDTVFGMALGLAGLLIVALPAGGGSGAGLALLAAAATTAGTLLSRQLGATDLVQAAGWHFTIGGTGLAAVASLVEGFPSVRWTVRFTLVLSFLSIVGTALTFWLWFVEAQRTRLASLTAWTFLTPVFGMVFGVLFIGERPGGWTSAGVTLTLIGMSLTLRHNPRSTRHRDGSDEFA